MKEFDRRVFPLAPISSVLFQVPCISLTLVRESRQRKRFFKVASTSQATLIRESVPARGLDVRALTNRGTAFLVRY